MSAPEELLDREIFETLSKDRINEAYAKRSGRLINDSSIFLKGLFGMILCILPGTIIGLILLKISFDQSKQAISEYRKAPAQYTLSSYRKVKTGRTFVIIGLVVFLLEIAAVVVYTGQ